ncbi:ARM repeat-containing protein [Exidia glandulosa HHB12029]|uniref:ARM repeat-containing protein n=1 Tax=Exidia glandulosa HHB12029 TaxID=1314781 RepID=A0A165LCK0_EXIGL|nr:ARM repeat-containing protein [Exidia glandulosa HHB12029]
MDGAPPPEEDFSALPVADRLAHKNWKARVSAYETMIKTFQATASESDPAFRPYVSNGELLKKIALDANAVAQEKAVECLVALVKFAGENAARTREEVMPAVVDKCLGSTRAGTKNNAIELVLQYVEMENSADGCIRDILGGLGAKQPKTVAGCVTALKEIVRVFGIQPVSPALLLKAMPKIFGHSDKTVRAEGTALCQHIYQCIGAAIQPSLADLKPVQVKELTEGFEKMDTEGKGKGSLVPERYTRDEARKRESAPPDAEDAPAEPEEVDPRSFAEEVNVVPQMPANFHGNLASSKWKDRKEALDDFLVVLQKAIRIQDVPELGDTIKALAEKMKDVNINCVITAANCLEALAKGLGSSFARYKEVTIPPILDRMKERKPSVTDALGTALDAIFASTTISDIIELIIPPLSNKSPQVKEGTVKFIQRCLANATKPPSPAQVKPLADALAITLGDSVEVVRDFSAQALGCLMKIVGERAMNPILEPLDDLRKAKVKEQYEKATVKCKAGAPAPPKPAPPPAAAPKKKAPVAKKPEPKAAPPPEPEDDPSPPPAPPKKAPPARLLAKKPAAAAPAAPAAKKPPPAAAAAASKGGAAPAPGSLDTFKYKHTPEAAEELAVDMIPANIANDLGDANWKLRLAAFEEMITWLEGGAVETVDSEVVVRFIAKKCWNEKNFQVSSKAYLVLSMLADRCPTFGRPSVALAVGHLCEKLGDIKLKKPAGDTLGVFAEKTSLSFVLNQAYEPMSKQKAPKVIADSITWINTSLTEFGIAGLSLRALIDFLKEGLKNSNAAVRTSATNCIVTVKLFAGAGIKDLIQDLNPQLLGTITSEFDKADGTPAPTPTRQSAEVASAPAGGAGGKGASSDPLDELFPRVELDKLLGGTSILTDAKSDNFKLRKEALETLQGLLDVGQNKRLKPSMGEIREILKARVNDSNKAVQVLALDIIARIASGMNKPFEKYSRLYVTAVCSVLADQKANIRSAGLVTLSAMAEACEGLDSMIPGLAVGLETANPLLRGSLTGWLSDFLKENEGKPLPDLGPLAGPLVACLDDKNGDVRKGSLTVLPYVIGQIGFDKVEKETSSLKPASKAAVMPLLQQARANAPSRGAAAPPAPAKAAPAPKAVQAAAAAAKAPSPAPQERAASPAPSLAPSLGKPGGIPSRATGVRRNFGGPPSRPDSRADSVKENEPAAAGPVSRLAKPGGLRRPMSMAFPAAPSPAPPAAHPAGYFMGNNSEAKRARLAKDSGRWIIEGAPVRKDLGDVLHHQMEGHVAEEVLKHLFSTGHDPVADYVVGATEMLESFAKAVGNDLDEMAQDELRATLLANSDLPLKYFSLRIHEPPPSLVTKCLDLLDGVLTFFRTIEYQVSDTEAQCFAPTLIHKLGDAREPVRNRVSVMLQSLSRVYAYSRIFQLLLEHGLRSKVAKTRQGALDELSGVLKRSGLSACDPAKAFPVIATMISDKDASVRKAALATLGDGYTLVGEKIWSLVGSLSPKDKTQLEERLRRVPGPAAPAPDVAPTPAVSRVAASGLQRPGSPGLGNSRIGGPAGIPRPSSPAGVTSRLARPASPSRLPAARSTSPAPSLRPPSTAGIPRVRPTSMLPSRLGPPRARPAPIHTPDPPEEEHPVYAVNGYANGHSTTPEEPPVESAAQSDDITITISSILSNDPGRSVEALKKIQKILDIAPEASHTSSQFRELSDHTEGLIETITLQMGHVFDKVDSLIESGNFRLAKHLIQTLNSFCDHSVLAESLTVDILQSLLEELTLRLLHTDESKEPKIKDLSRFINMLILRLFAVARRVAVFRALFGLLLQLVKPFPSHGTLPDAPEARVAELVLKCVWKLARNIPGDLEKNALDPIELFPAIEHFLQSIPPNEWRARATNRVPSGDMPLRTIKVIIQHVVAHYGTDDTYEVLTQAFEDPSATIVYPYVFRILNSNARTAAANGNGESPARTRTRSTTNGSMDKPEDRGSMYSSGSPPRSSAASTSSAGRNRHGSPTRSSTRSQTPPLLPSAPVVEEPDPDVLLLKIIDHISSETTGALHKEGITELHQFMKTYPAKKPKVDKLLEATGPAFRKYIARALASRAAEDQERVGGTAPGILTRAEESQPAKKDTVPSAPSSPSPSARTNITASASSPRRMSMIGDPLPGEDRLSRLHDVFQYRRNVAAKEEGRPSRLSIASNGSGSGLPSSRSGSGMDS